MIDKQIQKILDDSYDESKEEGLLSIVRDFYSRNLLSSAFVTWVVGFAFIALAVYSAVCFFKTDEPKLQIMYAALFLLGAHEFDVVRMFTWQMVHRYGIKREIKRLELRFAELGETLNRK